MTKWLQALDPAFQPPARPLAAAAARHAEGGARPGEHKISAEPLPAS
jgi:hypothetical protein